MRKVLIIYPFSHQFSVVEGKCNYLKEHGVLVDALLIEKTKIKYHSFSRKCTFVCRCLSFLMNRFKIIPGFYRLGLNKKIQFAFVKSLIKNYDLLELAGVYSYDRLQFAEIAKANNKIINVNLWGTDFNGILDFENDWHKELFEIANKIVIGTKTMENAFIKAYPRFKNKVYQVSGGLQQLELLKNLLDGKEEKDISYLNKEAYDKIIITVGYTGRTWQQHFYILDALEKLPNRLKEKVFIIVPMTYDTNFEYLSYIRKRLSTINIPHQILVHRLNLVQNLSLRIISDIAICVQLTDGLAASVREHIMAGSVFIGGDWLPYRVFLEKGMYYKPSSLENLSNILKETIENIQEEKGKCIINKKLMYDNYSWKRKSVDLIKEIY